MLTVVITLHLTQPVNILQAGMHPYDIFSMPLRLCGTYIHIRNMQETSWIEDGCVGPT